MTKAIEKTARPAKAVAVKVAPPSSVEGVGQMLAIAVQQGLSPEGLTQLVDLHDRMRAQAAKEAYAAAMAAVQAELPMVAKRGWNTHTKSSYSLHEDVLAAMTPIITRHGFSLSYGTRAGATPEWLIITCVCAHSAGHSEHFELPLLLDSTGSGGTKNKTGVQAAGSTITYGRRYLAFMVFNLNTGDDTDGGGDGDADKPTETQLADLDVLIKDAKLDPKKVLAFAKAESFADLDLRTFNKVVKKVQITISSGGRK
jgi:hypothetical protein